MAKFKETEIKHVEKVEVSANKLRGLADLLEKTFKTKDNVMVDLYVVPGVEQDALTFAFDFPEPEPKQSAQVVPEVKPEVKPEVPEDPKTAETKTEDKK